jgi:hypothetical protein
MQALNLLPALLQLQHHVVKIDGRASAGPIPPLDKKNPEPVKVEPIRATHESIGRMRKLP